MASRIRRLGKYPKAAQRMPPTRQAPRIPRVRPAQLVIFALPRAFRLFEEAGYHVGAVHTNLRSRMCTGILELFDTWYCGYSHEDRVKRDWEVRINCRPSLDLAWTETEFVVSGIKTAILDKIGRPRLGIDFQRRRAMNVGTKNIEVAILCQWAIEVMKANQRLPEA